MRSFHVFLILSLLCSGCYFKATINGEDKDLFSSSTTPLPTLSLVLQAPGYLISDDSTPSFDVTGVTVGETLKLYSDNTCSTEIKSIPISSSPQTITSPTLSDGSYFFSARTVNSQNEASSCAVMSGTYLLDTQTPTISSITPTTLTTFTGGSLTVNGTHFVQGSVIHILAADGLSLTCTSPALVSQTQLTCTAPGFNEAIVSVQVTKPAGANNNLANALTYEAPLPTAPVCFLGGLGGIVNAITYDSTQIYVAGSFTSMGTCMGGGVPLSPTTGLPSPAKGSFPEVAGSINEIVSDNNGGYFIAGNFSSVGGQKRNNIAHILSDLSIDPNIGSDATIGAIDNSISAMAYDGTNLYLGGNFTSIGKKLNSQGAQISSTGTVDINQVSFFGGSVLSSLADGSGGFYVGGDFS